MCRSRRHGHTQPTYDAAAHGIRLNVIKLPEARHDVVLLVRREVVERGFAWMVRFRRLAQGTVVLRQPNCTAAHHLLAADPARRTTADCEMEHEEHITLPLHPSQSPL